VREGQHRSLVSGVRQRAMIVALALCFVGALGGLPAPPSSAQTFTVLHSFTGTPDGANPYSSLVRDASGNLYGTTYFGGTGNGAVFQVNPSGTESVLYAFSGSKDGSNPNAGLILDASNNLYGTTVYTGSLGRGFGTVFRVNPSGKETVVHAFGYKDGAQPYGSVVLDSAGNLYGTTSFAGNRLFGTVFKLNSKGKATVLYSFNGKSDGSTPFSGVVLDASGNVYGTAPYGGGNCFGKGCGVVFKVTGVNHESVLYTFAGGPNDGAVPYAGLVRDAAGNLYGATYDGGTSNFGTIFKLDPSGVETVLYNFAGTPDGAYPNATLTLDPAGNLYGTTQFGGATGLGSVFKVAKSGKEKVLYGFAESTNGANPMGGVILDPAGNLYGTTVAGGSSNLGVVFQLKP